MGQADYDIVVIGGGPAGLAIGRFGPKMGARVAIVEAAKLGGDCTWHGCVPSKALLASARAATPARNREALGLPPLPSAERAPGPMDIRPVMERIRRLQEQIYQESDRPEMLPGTDVIEGWGQFVSPQVLEVGERRITAGTFVIATGGSPVVPPIPGLADAGYLTNRTVFEIDCLPRRLAVIGGGPIGLEMGQAFQRLGSQVTIIEAAPQVLPRAEASIAATLCEQLQSGGIKVHVGTTAAEVRVVDGAKRIRLQGSGADARVGESEVVVDEILVAVGQRPNVDRLGLEAAGVEADPRGGVVVNKRLRTSNKRIYACGDAIGGHQFTHVAAYEAGVVLHNALFAFPKKKAEYGSVPWAVFTDPEVAGVGLSEADARAKHGDAVHVYRHNFRELDRALLDGNCVGFIRLITVGSRRKVVGAQIVGPSAGELIQEHVLAIDHGMNALDLTMTHHAYPTLNEVSRWAALHAVDEMLDSPRVQRLIRLGRGLGKRPW